MTAPAFPELNRLVSNEVSLGTIREMLPPQDHIGLGLVPFKEVPTDNVIFDYISGGLSEGLAPARSDEAEAELAQKDEGAYIQGRASLIDWSLKDRYDAADVTRWRDARLIQAQVQGMNSLVIPANGGVVGSVLSDFNARVARHDALRRRKLDNRLEWLVMSSLENGKLTYNDGKIAWQVDWKRPASQQNQAPASGVTWDQANADPIGDLIAINQAMWDTYKVTVKTAITSTRVLNSFWKAQKFLAAFIPVVGGTPSSTLDPNYLAQSYGPQAALSILKQSTGIDNWIIYDSVYRTRPYGGTTWTNNRFTSDHKIILLPDMNQIAQIDETDGIGFGKMLTSPHPAGNWSPGFYSWEEDKIDPWMTVRGSGIKAFPFFPFMKYSYVLNALPAAA